ncbi:MAG TPA: hypothetical protein VIJ68_01350 [Candidatus Saccharimonadales bacterium]
MANPWEIQPGVGARILEGLGEDVRLRAQLGPPTAQLEAEAIEARTAVGAIINYGYEKTVADLGVVTARPLVDRLLREQQRHLAKAQAGAVLLQRIKDLEGRTHLQKASDQRRDDLRVRMVALVPYAVERHYEEGWFNERTSKTLQPGEELEGCLRDLLDDSIISAPTVGGRLTMESERVFSWQSRTVTGLVSPETGEPQVELEVLARRGHPLHHA